MSETLKRLYAAARDRDGHTDDADTDNGGGDADADNGGDADADNRARNRSVFAEAMGEWKATEAARKAAASDEALIVDVHVIDAAAPTEDDGMHADALVADRLQAMLPTAVPFEQRPKKVKRAHGTQDAKKTVSRLPLAQLSEGQMRCELDLTEHSASKRQCMIPSRVSRTQ